MVSRREFDRIVEVLKGYQESLERQNGMIMDLIKLNQNVHTRLLYLEAEMADRL